MKIEALHICTNDIAATAAFYAQIPGLNIKQADDRMVTISAGRSLLIFHHTADEEPVYHFAFTVARNSLAEAATRVSAITPLLPLPDGQLIADFSNWDAHAFYFSDNNGNIVEFIDRHSLEATTTSSFEWDGIECLSEAGLVTGNVMAEVATLADQYGVYPFSKQAPQENFSVCGTDDGLLIVVAAGREWYPTATPAKCSYARVEFINDKGERKVVTRHC